MQRKHTGTGLVTELGIWGQFDDKQGDMDDKNIDGDG